VCDIHAAGDLIEINRKLKECHASICERNRWLEEQLAQQARP
jgi:hypothetical protein